MGGPGHSGCSRDHRRLLSRPGHASGSATLVQPCLSPENSLSSPRAEPRSRRGTSPTSRPPSARKRWPRSVRSRFVPSSSRSTTSRGTRTTRRSGRTSRPASRGRLQEALLPELMTVVRHLSTDQDTTRKTLWRLFDGTLVESVLMRYPDRVTMCISSQAGCGMNCPFCATGQAGLDRNLSTAEIVHQIVDGMRALRDGEIPGGPARLSNIVFMGMGEPLANYNRVVGAIHAAHRPRAGRARALAAWDHRLDRRTRPGDQPLHRRGLQVAGSPSPCTPPTTSCATPSSP